MDPKRRKAKLDRRNAGKNIVYDATPSSSPSISTSPSLNDYTESVSQFTRSLEFSDKMSFRVEGIAGEFDRICRSLGLSGPEDFAIPVAAWEARKQRSTSDHLPRSSFNRLDSISSNPHLQDKEETVIDLPDRFVDSVIGGGGGIKGDRPPVLAPPPAMMRTVIEDDSSSTWDLFRAFGPDDGDEAAASMVAQLSRFSVSEQEVDDKAVVRREEESEMWNEENEENAGSSESCSFTTSNNDDDSSSTATDPPSNISPNVRSKPVIRDWDKGELLGRGSFGSVYEGITEDGFFFAIKEVSLIDQGSQAKQSLFQLEQEIDLLSRFEHENIVQYYGTEKDEKNLYIFLELVTKGSLQSLYQKYHLRDNTVSAYTRQILHGLKYLHDQGVVHRDIKCANILVDASGSVKLADFGLAKATKLNDVKSCKGTAFWMAPEVVNRKNHGYGLPADIWSLGCTVLEMLTRLIPYSHLECMQALFRIGRGQPPPVSDDLPADARDFILQCLQVNPNDRPPASQLLDHPFVKRPMSTSSGSASPFHFGRRI